MHEASLPLAEMKTQGRGEVEASEDAGSTKLRRRVRGDWLARPGVDATLSLEHLPMD